MKFGSFYKRTARKLFTLVAMCMGKKPITLEVEPSMAMNLALNLLAIGVILLGIFPGPLKTDASRSSF